MFNPIPLMVTLSANEKRAVQIVLVFLAVTFIIVGLVANLIKARLNKEGEVVDAYMYPLIRYNIIKDPKEFRSYVYRRETRQLYVSLRWSLRFILVATTAYVLYMVNFQQGDFSISTNILKDMFFDLHFPTVRVFGLTLVSDWPTVIKAPEFYLTVVGYATYIMALCFLGFFFKSARVTLAYLGRLNRSSAVATKSFSKNLEKGVDPLNDE